MRPKIVGPEKIKYSSHRMRIKGAKLRFPGKKPVEWEYLEHPDIVVMLALDKNNNVHLVKEWRLAWKRDVLQIPGGVCDSKTEKGRLAQAHNELREELGMDAKNIRKLGSFLLGSTMKSEFHLYLATGLFSSEKAPDEYEFIKTVKMPFRKAYDLFVNGKKPVPASSLITFLLADKFVK